MRRAAAEPTLGVVSAAADPLRVILELAPDREPVEGSLQLGPGQPLAFTGWMELIAALESIVEKADPRTDGATAGVSAGEEA